PHLPPASPPHRPLIHPATRPPAQMQGADMSEARMQGADLRHAQTQGATLYHAQLRGADLRDAQLQGSNCEGTEFLGALVQSADLTCLVGTLTQRQLEFTVGDVATILPEGLHVWSCLDRSALAPQVHSQIKATTAHYSEERNGSISRAEFEDLLFCDSASRDSLRRVPHEVGHPPE
ncbi:MAG: pentapeptide repeat-containing protein, partial [Nitrococcus sp.]|nr:pentapeptide repeat-containing protein [Nitrococcus sp.]